MDISKQYIRMRQFVSRLLSEDDDDQVNNYQDTETLINTLWVNCFFFAILVIAFEINRYIKPIYLKRRNKKFIQSGRVPEEPPHYPFGWIVAISKINDEEILRSIGLDGYMLLRYIIVCFRFSVFIGFWALLVLTPLYKQAGDYVGWNQYTLANVPDDPNSSELWAPAIFAYIFTAYFCFALYSEYKNFVQRRIDYLINGDLDTPPQTYYTILIEKIPASLRSEPRLRAFFEKLFPNEVFSVEIALNLGELDDLCDRRHQIRDKLEKAIAFWNATGKRPTVWIARTDKTLQSKEYLSRCHQKSHRSELAALFGYSAVDSIDYHEVLLSQLNSAVEELQDQYFQQQRQHVPYDRGQEQGGRDHHHLQGRIEVQTRDAINNISQKINSQGVFGSFVNVFRSDGSGRQPVDHNLDRSRSKEEALLEHDSLGQMTASQVNVNFTSDEEKRRDSALSTSGSADETLLSDSEKRGNNVLDKIRTAAGTGVEELAKEGYKTAQYATKGALRGVLEATRAFELLTVGAYYSTSSTGFITLNSRVATNCSSQMLLSQKYFQLQVKLAPNPKDIIWDNVSIPQQQINIRHRIADNTLIVGALFWSFVVGFITTIANLDSLAQQYTWLQVYSNTQFYKFLNAYLAVGLLLVLLSVLPLIFDIIARNYEGLKLESEIQNSIMSRYFYYQLANVFVSVGLGSLASSIHQIIEQPTSILSIIGNSFPNLSIYFTNLVIVRTLTAVPIEMLRLWPLIQVLSVKSCLDSKKFTRRELQTGAFADPPMYYGWIYPSIMMVLMIMVTYCCIAPLIVPFCIMFFGFVFLMYKYQLLYVYITDYQSGGFMWYAVFTRSLVCLFFGISTLLCYLGIRQTIFTGPFYLLLPLPFIILGFMSHCNTKFQAPSEVSFSLLWLSDLMQIVCIEIVTGELD
jgi:hypothetical protein